MRKTKIVCTLGPSTDNEEVLRAMIESGIGTFIEIGPGRTLAGFMKKINKEVKVYNIAALSDIEKVAAEMEASC